MNRKAIHFLLVVLGAIGLLLILFHLAGVKPFHVMRSFAEGISGYHFEKREFLGWGFLSEVLRRATPLIITGLGVFLALQAGLFNIGAEGQLRVGGIVAAAAAIYLGVNGPLGILLAATLGAIAGMLWALPAGLIKVWRGGHEVITTIMLNNIAGHVATFLIAGPMLGQKGGDPSTALIPDSLRLVPFGVEGKTIVVYHGLLVGIFLCVLVSWWLFRTPKGYELRATGANPVASLFAGVKVKNTVLGAMVASGAIAGLAGAIHLLGQEGRYSEGFSPGFGFDSLGVALLAGRNPLGVIPAALLFAAIDQGAVRAQVADGLPKEVSAVIQGLVILVFALYRYRRQVGE